MKILSLRLYIAHFRSDFMIKLLFSNHVSEDKRRKMIEDYKRYHLLKYEKFKKMEEDLKQPI